MHPYLQIIKGTIDEYATYRLSFILWRVRLVVQLLVVYFMWWALFAGHNTLFGYSQGAMLTYVLFSSFVRPFVMGTGHRKWPSLSRAEIYLIISCGRLIFGILRKPGYR